MSKGYHFQGRRVLSPLKKHLRDSLYTEVLTVCENFFDELSGEEVCYELRMVKHKVREYYDMKYEGKLVIMKEHPKVSLEITDEI